MILMGEIQSLEENPTATLATTNPTQTVLGFNPGLHNDGLATNCLGHGFRQGNMVSQQNNICHTKRM